MHVFSSRLREFFPLSPSSADSASGRPVVGPPPLEQVVVKRLEIAHRGLEEVRRHLGDGRPGDAQIILDKLEEDLFLLRQRLCNAGDTPAGQAN
jgi:hypothetical protein